MMQTRKTMESGMMDQLKRMIDMKKQQRRKVSFVGQVQEMAEDVVMSHVGKDKLDVVRARDAHPMFIGLKVAEQGLSNGELTGMGPQAKMWPAHAVEQLGWAMNWGDIGLYDRHLKEGEDRGARDEVGTVLSGFAQSPEGSSYGEQDMEAFAVGYIDQGEPREKVSKKAWDTCSIEAECVFLQDRGGQWVVDSVQEVTGIALANSNFQQPGFPGASIVAVIQELENAEGEEQMEPTEKEVQEALQKMSSDAIRTLISGTSLQPSQLFTSDQLQADPAVQQIGSQLSTDLATARQELTTVKAENSTLKASAAQGTVATQVAKKVAGLKGLEEGEKTLISDYLLEKDFSAADNLEEAITQAVDSQVQKLNKIRADYGKEEIGGAPAEDEEGDKKPEDEKGPELKVADEDPFLAANKATKDGQLVEV